MIRISQLRLKVHKLLLITVFLVSLYFLFISYPYFFSKITRFDSLGFLSAIEEQAVDFKLTQTKARVADKFDNHMLAGEKVVSKFNATENSLGMVLVRFARFGEVSDTVVFRIKEEGKDSWYYENNYKADQFQPNQYFTFGFPSIAKSQNKAYVFEIESLSGTYKNGIGVSSDKPQVALVYKYTREDLKSFNTLFSFISKKLVYVLRNVSLLQNWKLLVIFYLPLIFVFFVRKKNTVTGVLRSLSTIKKNHKRILRVVVSTVKYCHFYYVYYEKKTINLLKKIVYWFASTRFYLLFLNTNTKKRLAIGLLIFLLAFTYRYSATLVDILGVSLFYDGLGGGSDYDQFIQTATCALNFCPAILGQNMPLEAPLLGIHYKIFGFTGGLGVYLYLMIILSSIVATLPYLLLSRKSWITIGGIIGSLYLATSDYLTHMALNFPPDNGSLFTFSIFFIVYLLTLNFGTIRWLLFFGFAGFFDGMFKALFLINDLVAFAFFAPVYFYEKAIKKTMSARQLYSFSEAINQIRLLFKKKNTRILFLSLIPLIVFLTLYIALEVLTYTKFSEPYFLRGILISNGSTYVPYTSLSDSSLSGNIVEELLNAGVLAIIMMKHLIENANLQIIFLAPIFLGLLLFSFLKPKFPVKKFIAAFILSAFLVVLLTLIKNNYYKIHEIFNGDYIYAWTEQTYMGIFLFSEIIILFILNFKYSALKLSLPIIPYVVMLIIMAKNAPFARLHTHVVAWSVILLAFVIDYLMMNINKHSMKWIRITFAPLLLILFIYVYMFPKMVTMIMRLNSGFITAQNEVRYLKWVDSELPNNAIVLAGGKSDLVRLGENIKKPIVYSTLWTGALLIRPNEIPVKKPSYARIAPELKINEIPVVKSRDFLIVEELKNKDNFRKNKYILLEEDMDIWRKRLSGMEDSVFSTSSAALHGDDYSIKVYKFNPTLKKSIYELNTR